MSDVQTGSGPSSAHPLLHVTDSVATPSAATPKPAATKHDVFENPDLVARLYVHQTELGYKVGTIYSACVTAYVALTGFSAQQFFTVLKDDKVAAARIGVFALVMALMSLAAPFGLSAAMRHIEAVARTYSDGLSLPAESFKVISFGTWLSLAAFVAIAAAWTFALIRFAM